MIRLFPAFYAAVFAALISPVRAADGEAPVPARAPVPEAPAATSATVKVGAKTITVPYPAGYVRCDGVNSDFDAGMRSFMPPSNRLLAYFALPEDLKAIKDNTGSSHDKSFNLQIVKAVEDREIGERTFAGLRDQMKSELDKAKATVEQEIKRTMEQGNAKVKKDYGVDAALSVSGTAFLGYFEESDASLGFSMALKTKETAKDGKETTERSIASAVITPVNGRLLSFYVNFPYENEADRKVAEKAVAAWRDAVVAANPRVEGPEASSSQIGKVMGTLVGAGVAIAVVMSLAKKKRAAQGG